MSVLLMIITVLVTAIVLIVFSVRKNVCYSESVVINTSASELYNHIRLQERLMRWSAWPSVTGSTCTREGADGEIGAQTVFFDKKGNRFGYQEIVSLDVDKRVEFKLKSKGPEQQTKLWFELEPLSATQTKVMLQFDNVIARPFNVILRLIGIVRWTRGMHCKDLAGLKRYAEPPHQTYVGEPASELMSQ